MTTAVAPAPLVAGLPLTLDLAGREVLLVGAGPVAARRAEAFLEAGAHLVVVAPDVDPGILALAAAAGPRVTLHRREVAEGDLDTPWLVHTATGSPEVDRWVAELCSERRVWCVSAGDARVGSARVPARTAVDTPTGAVRIAVDSGDPRRSLRVGRDLARSLATEATGLRAHRRGSGWTALVVGGADPDLLTVRARRLIHSADVLVADGPPHPSVRAELDDDVELVDASGLGAPEVDELLLDRAAAGAGVVRILPGTALARSADSLRRVGMDPVIVPGVVDAP